ncbi:hypothetical protein BB560_004154, partial [Smittium megazygosporum]
MMNEHILNVDAHNDNEDDLAFESRAHTNAMFLSQLSKKYINGPRNRGYTRIYISGIKRKGYGAIRSALSYLGFNLREILNLKFVGKSTLEFTFKGQDNSEKFIDHLNEVGLFQLRGLINPRILRGLSPETLERRGFSKRLASIVGISHAELLFSSGHALQQSSEQLPAFMELSQLDSQPEEPAGEDQGPDQNNCTLVDQDKAENNSIQYSDDFLEFESDI